MTDVLKGMASLTCERERQEALKLWSLLYNDNLTDLAKRQFDHNTADVYFNADSGNVFLSDENFNTVMDNGGELDLFINTPYNGEEGYFEDLMSIYENMHEEDKEYLKDLATDELKEKYKDKFMLGEL